MYVLCFFWLWVLVMLFFIVVGYCGPDFKNVEGTCFHDLDEMDLARLQAKE